MRPLEFNTLDNLADNNKLHEIVSQAQESIKEMQIEVPQYDIPNHVVLPIIQNKENIQYVIAINGEPHGPFTIEQIKKLLLQREITEETYIWTQGWSNWHKIKDCPQL